MCDREWLSTAVEIVLLAQNKRRFRCITDSFGSEEKHRFPLASVPCFSWIQDREKELEIWKEAKLGGAGDTFDAFSTFLSMPFASLVCIIGTLR